MLKTMSTSLYDTINSIPRVSEVLIPVITIINEYMATHNELVVFQSGYKRYSTITEYALANKDSGRWIHHEFPDDIPADSAIGLLGVFGVKQNLSVVQTIRYPFKLIPEVVRVVSNNDVVVVPGVPNPHQDADDDTISWYSALHGCSKTKTLIYTMASSRVYMINIDIPTAPSWIQLPALPKFVHNNYYIHDAQTDKIFTLGGTYPSAPTSNRTILSTRPGAGSWHREYVFSNKHWIHYCVFVPKWRGIFIIATIAETRYELLYCLDTSSITMERLTNIGLWTTSLLLMDETIIAVSTRTIRTLDISKAISPAAIFCDGGIEWIDKVKSPKEIFENRGLDFIDNLLAPPLEIANAAVFQY